MGDPKERIIIERWVDMEVVRTVGDEGFNDEVLPSGLRIPPASPGKAYYPGLFNWLELQGMRGEAKEE